MGLKDGYGVLLGTLQGYKPDDEYSPGKYIHGVLTVRGESNTSDYTCAVDVDTSGGKVPVLWRIQPLRIEEWAPILELADGWHTLGSDDSSGAVDYIRDPRLKSFFFLPEPIRVKKKWGPLPPLEYLSDILPHRRPLERLADVRSRARKEPSRTRASLLRRPIAQALRSNPTSLTGTFNVGPVASRTMEGNFFSYAAPWNIGASAQALADLEAVIQGAARIIVFGEPFTYGGNGVHNIHQNQGDVIGGGHDDENAIWQDGLTVAIRNDGTASAFMNRFGTQSDETDEDGRPI